jgi:hypothetical protein
LVFYEKGVECYFDELCDLWKIYVCVIKVHV